MSYPNGCGITWLATDLSRALKRKPWVPYTSVAAKMIWCSLSKRLEKRLPYLLILAFSANVAVRPRFFRAPFFVALPPPKMVTKSTANREPPIENWRSVYMLLPGGRRGRLQADEAAAGRNERLLWEVLPFPAELPLHVAASGPEGLAAAVAISLARCCFAVPFKQVCACSPVSAPRL